MSVEGGCRTDLEIPVFESYGMNQDSQYSYSMADYMGFFDEAKLDRMMNEWFQADAMAPAA